MPRVSNQNVASAEILIKDVSKRSMD
jgi:hypothetical protein